MDSLIFFAVPGSATVLLGNGAGSFAAIAQPPVAKGPWGIASGDFDSDGKLDLVVSSISNDPTDIVTVMLGNGDGSFDAGVEHEVGGNPQFVKVADLDDDGNDDIVLVSSDAEAVSVFLGQCDGNFPARGDFAMRLASDDEGANPTRPTVDPHPASLSRRTCSNLSSIRP